MVNRCVLCSEVEMHFKSEMCPLEFADESEIPVQML